MSAYLRYLSEEAARLSREAARLRAEGREDEASFARIRVNIHGICRTLYEVCGRTAPGEGLRAAYLQKIDRLAGEWNAARARALEHDDRCKAAIEDIKLETLAKARVAYLEGE